jgi:hypothetical protein
MKRALSSISVLALSLGVSAWAQNSPCPTQVLNPTPTESSDLVCVLPQVYGPGGLVGTNYGGPINPTTGHEAHFQSSTVNDFTAINAEIGLQLSQVPLAAPVTGITFQNGIFQETIGLGPVLTDRAETIGQHAFFIGANYEYFDFDQANNVNLRNFGAVFQHEYEPCPNNGTILCYTNSDNQSVPVYSADVIGTQNHLNLNVHQFSIIATYGLNSRWDISLAVPIEQIHMNMISNATIFNFEPPPVNHSFDPSSSVSGETYISPSNAIFNKHETASGVGDIRLRNKFVVWKSDNEKSAIATGVDVRFPTGDAYNFLGSGTWGVRPFAIFSHSSRVSPHFGAGLEVNGQSILQGYVTSQPVTKGHLPDVFSYNAGIDTALPGLRWLGLSADYIGNALLSASAIGNSTYTDYVGDTHSDMQPSEPTTINEQAVSLGAKIRAKKLLVVGNCLIRTNDAGLHYKPSPLVGLSYTF